MNGMCIVLLYSSFAQCFINTANMALCGPRVKDFSPIYSMYACSMRLDKDLYHILYGVNNLRCEDKK